LRDTQAYIPKSPVPRRSPSLLPAGMLAPTRVATIAAHASIGHRMRWQAVVAALTPGVSALHLTDIQDLSDVRVWAEIWVRYTGHLRTLGLRTGETVTFVARMDRQLDGTYALHRPGNFARVAVHVPVCGRTRGGDTASACLPKGITDDNRTR